MKRMDTEDKFMLAGIIAFIAIVAVVITCAIVHWYHEYHRCVDNGGHFEDRDCHVVHGSTSTCTFYDQQGNCMMWSTQETSSTECDSVCIGARAEAL